MLFRSSSLTVNPACVRCDIVICDMCLYHRDAHCMCVLPGTALAAGSHFGSRKGVSNDSNKEPVEKQTRFEEMLDWYEENHNGDWFETAKFVEFEPTRMPLFYKERGKCVLDPMTSPWELKQERDKAIRDAARLFRVVYPEGEFKKSNQSYVEQCSAAARRRFILDSGASADLVGEEGLDEEERRRVKKAEDVLNLSTANGPAKSTDEVELDVPNLGIRVKTRILGDCPDVLSMGIRCAEQGFGFYWDPFSYKPRLVRPDGHIIRCSYARGGVPMVPATIEENDSEAETCAPDSIDGNLAYQYHIPFALVIMIV